MCNYSEPPTLIRKNARYSSFKTAIAQLSDIDLPQRIYNRIINHCILCRSKFLLHKLISKYNVLT